MKGGSRSISAIAVTSQRQSLVFLDESGGVIYGGPNTDLRAVFEGFALDFEHGRAISAATGGRPAFMTAPGKLAWFRDHSADAYGRIAYVLTLADWLTFRLTGSLGCERTLASESGLTDMACPGLASPMLRRLELDCPIPPIHEALSVRGAVSIPELRHFGVRACRDCRRGYSVRSYRDGYSGSRLGGDSGGLERHRSTAFVGYRRVPKHECVVGPLPDTQLGDNRKQRRRHGQFTPLAGGPAVSGRERPLSRH